MMEAASSQSVANSTRVFSFFQFCDIKKLTKKISQKNSKFNETHAFFPKISQYFLSQKKS